MTDKSNNLIEAAIKNGAGVSETLAGVPIKIVVDEAQLQATIDAVSAQTNNEPVGPEYYWNNGDEYTMRGSGDVDDWARDNDFCLDGDVFELCYAVTGKAVFTIQDGTPIMTDYSPKYFTAPPSQPVNDALEKAAKIADEMPLKAVGHHKYRNSDDCKAMAWDIAHHIRALKDKG